MSGGGSSEPKFWEQNQPAGFSGRAGYQQPFPQTYGQNGRYNTLARDMSMGRLGSYHFGGHSPFGYTPAFSSPWQGGYASPATYGAKGMAPSPYGGFSGRPAARLPTPGFPNPLSYQPQRPWWQGTRNRPDEIPEESGERTWRLPERDPFGRIRF